MRKENKGGVLTNEQIEKDLAATGHSDQNHRGMQDTGDDGIRHLGTDVQKKDGAPPENVEEEGDQS